MSTLTVATVKSNSSSPPTFQNTSGTEIGRLCRAFVNFDGTTGTIRASYNVSSITKNGTGDYTVNFTTAMADANYTVCCTQADGTTAGPIPWLLGFNPGGYGKTVSITTTSIRVYSITSAGGIYDALYNYVAIFR